MYTSIGSRRSRRGATRWMVGWLNPVLILVALIGVGAALVDHWWWGALGLVTLIPTVTRLRITAGDPGTLRVMRSWLLIPYHVRHVALAQVTADHGYLDSGPAHDVLRAGDWEFERRDADGLLASLRTSSAELATPTALARR